MVWQKGKLWFAEFFDLFIPAAVDWLVPAAIVYFAIPVSRPVALVAHVVAKPGMWGVVMLFAATIVTAVGFKSYLSLPPAIGMMLGLGYLQMLAYGLSITGRRRGCEDMVLDSFAQVQRVEWDTLLFFFGIIFAVDGLGVLGYLALASKVLHAGLGPLPANVIMGLLSAVVDNIPLMFAVAGECDHGAFVGGGGQYSADVCRAYDGPCDEQGPLVADHADLRGGRVDPVGRLGCRGGVDGAGARNLYVHGASEVKLGGRIGVCCRGLGASVVECRVVLSDGGRKHGQIAHPTWRQRV